MEIEKPKYALSGYAEWFWLMAKNIKPVENRDWSLYRYIKPMELPIRIYLHASKKPASKDEINFIKNRLTSDETIEFNSMDFGKIRGTIIADITITGQVTASESKWFFGKYGFLVKDGKLLENPIPYKGQLGFFKVEV